MAEQTPETRQSMPSVGYLEQIVIFAAIAIATVLQFMLPRTWDLTLGATFIGAGVIGSWILAGKTQLPRFGALISVLPVVGSILLLEHVSFQYLSIVPPLFGLYLLVSLPVIERRRPELRAQRTQYLFLAFIVTLTAIPIYIAGVGMSWERPTLSCLALLPLAGWALLIAVVSLRIVRSTPVPSGIDETIMREQIERMESSFRGFLTPMPFLLAWIGAFAAPALLMLNTDRRVGAALAAATLLISIELLVRGRRHWSDRWIWFALGAALGSLTALEVAASSLWIEVAVALVFVAFALDAIASVLRRPHRWSVVPAHSWSAIVLMMTVPVATVLAAAQHLLERSL